MNSSSISLDHPAERVAELGVPDFLLMPVVEAAFATVKKIEDAHIPNSLRRISHFDAKALNHATSRAQIIQSMLNSPDFARRVEEEFFTRVEASVAFHEWDKDRAQEIVSEAAARNDLPLIASVLWLKRPEGYEFGLGLIVAHSSISVSHNEEQETRRADETRFAHMQTTLDKEKARADLLKADVTRLENELREERQSRRAREQRQEAQLAAMTVRVEQHDEVVERVTQAKDRQQQRVEREASRAHELENRLRLAHEDSHAKAEKISQLQNQLASALSSDLDLNYEDLQKLIVAQKNAEDVSRTILSIMNKTRSILSQDREPPTSTPSTAAPVQGKISASRTPVEVPGGMILDSAKGLQSVYPQKNLIVIIDGYNVSLNSFGQLTLELQRERTIACATAVEARFGPQCVIIFDGQSSTTRGRVQAGVHVVYSPADTTADDIIVERIRSTSLDKPILLITDDRNLRARAQGLGCSSSSAAAFVASCQ